jgi:hypothetical protein
VVKVTCVETGEAVGVEGEYTEFATVMGKTYAMTA